MYLKKPELLAPAGNLTKLKIALAYGADAVYASTGSFSLRQRSAKEFSKESFAQGVAYAHERGKKLYATVNGFATNGQLENIKRHLEFLRDLRVDGILIATLGVANLARAIAPEIPIHVSTQANVLNYLDAQVWAELGAVRIVAAREMTLKDAVEIKEKLPNLQIEIFVHGSMCFAYSGRCLVSAVQSGRFSNRGSCANDCRFNYELYAKNPETSALFRLQEREGEGTFVMNAKDLSLISHVQKIMQTGAIDSFKIEGRMKSAEYVGTVVAAYRYVMDHWKEDKKGAVITAKRMLASDFARSKSSYWYNFKTQAEGIEKAGEEILNPDQAGGTGIYLGKIVALKPAPAALVEAEKKNAAPGTPPEQLRVQMARLKGGSYDPDPGDSIRLHRRDDSGRMSRKVRSVETADDGARWIDVPGGFQVGDSVYLLQTKSMSKRYTPVLPKTLSPFRKRPGDDKLPELKLYPEGNPAGNINENVKAGAKNKQDDKRAKKILSKSNIDIFPDGFYVQVSSVRTS